VSNNLSTRPTAPTTVTVIDPRILSKLDELKADLKTLIERPSQEPQPQEPPKPSYFPRGYF
jgi:hypothetical protein